MKRVILAVAVTIALLSGCAGTTSDGVSVKAAKALRSYIEDVRTAASGKDPAALHSAVRALDAEVEKLVHAGELTNVRAVQIENQADVLVTDYIQANPSPSPTPSTPTPTPASPTPSSPSPTPTVTITTTVTPTDTGTPPAPPTP
jgi:hypothetical protein